MPPSDKPGKEGYLIKLLCPSLVTEQMPEYGVQWITGIRKYSGATIVISEDGELFPRTDDRVIAISGSYESIVKAIYVLVPDLLSVSSPFASFAVYHQRRIVGCDLVAISVTTISAFYLKTDQNCSFNEPHFLSNLFVTLQREAQLELLFIINHE